MANSINATSTSNGGLVTTGDDSGVLNIQTNETTAISIDASQSVDFTNNIDAPNTFGFKNRLINGAMMIDQRNAGASVTASTTGSLVYTLDRWSYYADQASKFTVQQNAGSVTPPAGYKNYLGVTVGASANVTVGSGELFAILQHIEGFNVPDFAWGTASASSVTLSFWVRSSLTGTFGGSIRNLSVDRSYPFSYTISSADTWEQKSITIVGETTGTWAIDNGTCIRASFNLGSGSTLQGTANTWATTNYTAPTGAVSPITTNSATFYITGVQLEKGTQATSFDFRSYGTELALCQRYFISYGGSASYERFGTCICASTNGAIAMMPFPVEMRTVPTFSYSSLANLGIYTGTAVIAVSAVSGDSPSPKVGMVGLSVASGLTTGNTNQFLANNTTSARVTWSAEL